MRARLLVFGLALSLAALLIPAMAADGHLTKPKPPKADKPKRKAVALHKRPNIIFVMTDDATLENMRVMHETRRLIGDQGATFNQYVVSYSLCCPSRATMMTGQYAHNNRVLGNRWPNGGYYRFRSESSLPVWLQHAGYYTAHVGKFLNGYGKRGRREIPAGWNDWMTSVDPTTYRYWDYTFNENGTLVHYGNAVREYRTDVDTRTALGIIKHHAAKTNADRAKPLYLQLDYLAPHSGYPVALDDPPRMATPEPAPRDRDRFAFAPLPTPPNYNEADVSDKPIGVRRRQPIQPYVRYAITEDYQQRLESMLSVDQGVAEIVRELRRTGELNNTYIFFSSDNGFFQGEHRIPSGKVLPYEESIRLPLLVRGPGIEPHTKLDQLVGNVDLAPTIAAMAHAKPELIQDGVSLLPLLETGRWDVKRNDIILEAGPFDKPEQEYTGLRTPRYMFAVYGNGEQELYDLRADPYELDNRAGSPEYEAIRTQLTERLQRLRYCAGASCRP
jgi:N-acetylglucosamine-6-sulfatase